jgi:endonuclease YncB( thermonuclease family)
MLIGGILSAPALALDPADQAQWQVAADRARVPLLVPDAPGFALDGIAPRSLACDGDVLGDAVATWRAPDGRTLRLVQGRPYGCGNGPESTLVASVAVDGAPASYWSQGDETPVRWSLDFERDGMRLSLTANFDDQAALVALAEGAVAVAPSRRRALDLTRLSGQVIRTVGADTVIVGTAAGRRIVRLAGIRAPQPARGDRRVGCGFGASRSELRRELPRGTAVIVETDPLRRPRDARGRLLAYVSRRSFAPYQIGSMTANYGMVASGAARVLRGRFRYRHQLATAERSARRDTAGLFTAPCKGRTAPLPPPPPPPTATWPYTTTPPGSATPPATAPPAPATP